MPEIALPELIFYALLFLTIAFAFAARKLTQALFGWLISALSSIPLIGGKLAAPFSGAERAIVGACASIESGCDRIMGASWHATARLMDWTWKEIRSHAAALAEMATPLGALITLYHGLRALVHSFASVAHGAASEIRTLTREYHGIEHRVKSLEHAIGAGIGADVLPRIKTLEREVAHVEGKVIPAVEGAETALQNDVTALGEYVRANYLSSATDAVTAAVVVALSALGLSGLRCNGLLNSLKNRGCGLWNGLEDLLGLFVDAVILTDLCAILPDAVKFFGLVEGELTGIISQAADAVCAKPPKGWVTLDVKPTTRPPAQTFDPTTL